MAVRYKNRYVSSITRMLPRSSPTNKPSDSGKGRCLPPGEVVELVSTEEAAEVVRHISPYAGVGCASL